MEEEMFHLKRTIFVYAQREDNIEYSWKTI